MAANKPATENNYAHLAGAFISPHPILAKLLLSEGEYKDAPYFLPEETIAMEGLALAANVIHSTATKNPYPYML